MAVVCPPSLQRVDSGGVVAWTDVTLRQCGVVIAFSERSGGVSTGPYESLNLAAHVGDDPEAVDTNRQLLLGSLGLGQYRDRLVTSEQVHGVGTSYVNASDSGRGAFASEGRDPIPGTDALLTDEPNLPLMLFFADCVPVVLVAPGPWIAVAHAGWRGALGGIAALTAVQLARTADVDVRDIQAYVGPHIHPCHYEVSSEILSQFVNTFGTVARAESGGLDLGFVVAASLRSAGVDPCNIASLGACTAEMTDRFFSHRAEAGLTGRHGALACILP